MIHRLLSREYNRGYTIVVKTAISLPDKVFEEAERLAKRRGISRSELYARAVAEFIKEERFLGVRERLDSVYGAEPSGSHLDPVLGEMQARSLPKEGW
jgi:hypothetical protein